MTQSCCLLGTSVVFGSLFAPGCSGPTQARPACARQETAASLRLDLPPSLEGERSNYAREVSDAQGEVAAFFQSAGFEVQPRELIDAVIVFDQALQARERLAQELGARPEDIPDTFSGTVAGRTLYVVSRDQYQEVWKRLYHDWAWTGEAYHQLIVHELAHRAHEALALAQFGSADAMGPPWFFEGLAVMCAGQFATGEPPLSRAELERLVGGSTPPVSYPLYGRIVRSLAAHFELRDLLRRASEPGFPVALWSTR